MIAKLISFSVVAGLIYGGIRMMDGQFEFAVNIGKIVSTSGEVHNIAKMLYYDYVINGRSLSTLSQDEFRKYLRDEMQSSDPARDTAKDRWFTPYRLTVLDNAGFEVRSAGPERCFGTDDDIVARGK
jgi:hypothetical protein